MPRAAIYVRVSTPGQEEDGTSLPTQQRACLAYAEQQGYQVVESIADVHTGAHLRERPGLDQLRQLVRAARVEVVVAYAIDRLTRDMLHLCVLIEEAQHHGVRYEFVTEPLDTSPEGLLLQQVKGYVGHAERAKIHERTRRGKRARLDAGLPLPGCRPPYGYQWTADRARLVPDPSRAWVVRRIYHEYLAGRTLYRIAVGLSADAVPPPRARAWNTTAVRWILLNPVYVGLWTYRGKEGVVQLPIAEPLVTPEDQARVRDQLDWNRRTATRRNRDPEATLLRGGLVRCDHCGAVVVAERRPNGKWAYRCANQSRPGSRCDGRPFIMADRLDAAVWAHTHATLADPRLLDRLLADLRAAQAPLRERELVQARLADLAARAERAADLLLDLAPDARAFVQARLERLLAEQRELAAQEARLARACESWERLTSRLADAHAARRRLLAGIERYSYQERRDLLRVLTVTVRLRRVEGRTGYRACADLAGLFGFSTSSSSEPKLPCLIGEG
jgi:site-specific DNA recombinase